MLEKLKSATDIDLCEVNRKPSFLFITANEYEKQEFLNYFTPGKNGMRKYVHNNGNTYYIGLFGKYPIIWIHLYEQGSNRNGASKSTVDEALHLFTIVATFSIGIAFGIDSTKQKIGDVLISRAVFPYELMRVSENKTSEEYELRDQLRESNKQLAIYLSRWEWINNTNSKHYVGTFLSGEKLIDSSVTKNKLLKALKNKEISDVIGGDMETSGIEQSHRNYGNNNWITVKGISDWGDGNKNNSRKAEYQQFAAKNSVKFLYGLFSSHQLENIFNINNMVIEKNKTIDDIQINGIKLFYYRNKNNLTIYGLAKALKKNRVLLKLNDLVKLLSDFETVDITGNTKDFKKTNYFILKKIETILNCKGKLSDLSSTEQEKFIYQNCDMHLFIPVTNIKAVVFDFDGTLTVKNDNKSCWQKLWSILGDPNNLCNEYYNMFKRNEINHKKWCELTLDYFKERKLTETQVKNLAKEISLIPDCKKVFKILKDKNIPIYICSGSIYTIINQVIQPISNFVSEIRANNFVFNGGIIHEINGTNYDFEGKRKYVEEIASKLNLNINEIAFIGNSDNDIYVGQSGARTILVNPHQVDPGIQKHWLYDLENINSLFEILPYLLPEDYTFKKSKM